MTDVLKIPEGDSMKLEPVAWIDEFGNTFPLAAYNGGKAWRDSHKHNWKPLYAIPEGYVVVPVEPTAAMNFAAYDECQRVSTVQIGLATAAKIYKAMIAAKEQS